jgi:hypothetical protein
VNKFAQTIYSKRFLEVLDELLDRRVIPTDTAFCKKVDYAQPSLSQIRGGTRDVPLELVGKMFTMFGGNPLYIFTGKGSLLFPMEVVQGVQEPTLEYRSVNADKDLIKTLEQLVETQKGNIEDLRKHVKQLEDYIATLRPKTAS